MIYICIPIVILGFIWVILLITLFVSYLVHKGVLQ